MIEKNKMQKLYNTVINEIKIDNYLLKNIGFTKEELTNLIKDNIIKPISTDEYQFIAINKLLHYAEELKQEGNISSALKCLSICRKTSPENRQILLNILLIYIRQNNQEGINKIFKSLDTTIDKDSIKENNLILYLLSELNKISKEYQDKAKKITIDDVIVVNEKEYQNIISQNKMRKCILENNFTKADMIIRKELNGCFRNQIEKEIIFTLLTQIIESKKKINTYIRSLIDNKDYAVLVSHLEKRHQIRKLNLYEAYVYKISTAIIRIQKVNKIPSPSVAEPKTLKDAIIGNNYRLALELANKKTPELTNHEEQDIVLTLLKIINNLITKIIQESQIIIKRNKENEAKKILLEEFKQMQESNEIIKILENIDESRKSDLILASKTIPELSLIVSRYKEGKIILRTIDVSYPASNNLSKKALSAYINGDYKSAILIYSKIIQTEEYIKADICGMLGLSYLHLFEFEKAIHYMKISIELDKGHKENKIDYKALIQYLEEPKTEIVQTKIMNIVNKHDAKLIEYDFKKEEELAYLITSENITLKEAQEKYNLTDEQVLLIKLIYARDNYILEDYYNGDNLVKEVANTKISSLVVVSLLTEVRRNRNSYKKLNDIKRKKLIDN